MASLVDQYGRTVSAGRLYPSPSSHARDSRPRPKVRPKIYENVTERDRQEQVAYASVIATRVPNIEAALGMKADFAVGDSWHVRYKGSNPAWGRRMEAYVNETYFRNCNLLGPTSDFHSTLKQLSLALDVQADYAAVFDNNTGLAQFIDCSRIGTGDNGAVSAGSGLDRVNTLGNDFSAWSTNGWRQKGYVINDPASPFDGARIVDGVIVDQNLRCLGLRVLGYDEEGEPTYADIPKAQIHFNFEAVKWLNQLRGIPSLANLLDDSNTVEDANYYWGQAIKLSAAMSVTRKTKDGRPATAAMQETEVTGTDLEGATRTYKIAVEDRGSGIVELSTDNNEEIGSVDYNRPSMEEAAFISRLETGFFHKHWPRGLIYTNDIDRAAGRAIAQQVRQIVWGRQRILERTARWWVDRAIAHGMRTGRIPENVAAFDPYDYEFTLPGEFTLDEGNDGKLWLSFLGRGCITRGIIANKQGYQAAEITDANELDEDDLARRAEALHAKHNWLSPREWLLRLNNPFTNPPPEPTAPDEPKPGKKTTAPKDDE